MIKAKACVGGQSAETPDLRKMLGSAVPLIPSDAVNGLDHRSYLPYKVGDAADDNGLVLIDGHLESVFGQWLWKSRS